MKRGGLLILAQADHLTGEELGFAVDEIMDRGAENVYIFPGITKKNRTGCVLLIDIEPGQQEEWSLFLAEHFAIYGFHEIMTSHYCSCARARSVSLEVRQGGDSFRTEVCFKMPKEGKGNARVEYGDLLRIHEQVKKSFEINLPLTRLRILLESLATADPNDQMSIDLGSS